MKRYHQYVADVNGGRVLACDALKKAVARFERDLVASKRRGARWTFDEAKADRVIAFCERLVQWEEPFAGVPIHLEPWECFFIAQLYGWRDTKSGRRRFRKALLYMARKQGKTILADALILYEVLSKAGIEAYSLATKQLVSNRSFKNLQLFIGANSEIEERVTIHKSPKSIYVNANASVYMPLSSDSKLDGPNPAFAHIDELAAQKDPTAYVTLCSGMGTRPESLTLITSTASDRLENPLRPEYDYGKQVLDGSIEDDAYLVAVYEYDQGDAWDDLTKMQKAAPNLGVSVPLAYFERELKEARLIPSKATEYRTKYCNLWQASAATWIPDSTWARCRANADKHRGAFANLARLPCFLALDFSTIWDYTALTLYFYLAEIDRFWARHRFYIPGDQVEAKAHTETPAIPDWISRGLIVATPGEIIDYGYVYRDIDEALRSHKVLGIVYDPAKARDFETQYASRATLVPFPQKATHMSPAAKGWERAIVDGRICDDSPVMRWMVSNAINKGNPDSGSYFITKNPVARDRRRIDGVITSMMAHSMLDHHLLENASRPPIVDLSTITY